MINIHKPCCRIRQHVFGTQIAWGLWLGNGWDMLGSRSTNLPALLAATSFSSSWKRITWALSISKKIRLCPIWKQMVQIAGKYSGLFNKLKTSINGRKDLYSLRPHLFPFVSNFPSGFVQQSQEFTSNIMHQRSIPSIPLYSQQNPLYTKLYVYLIIFQISLYHYPILFPLVSLGYFHTKSLFWDTCFMIFPDISFFVSLRFPKQSGNINRKYLEVGNSMVPDTLW